MPVFHRINPCFVVWMVKESLPELLSLLPAGVQIPAYKAESRRLEWVVVHVLVQVITGKFQLVKHRDTGAPYLEDDPRYLSISHITYLQTTIVSASVAERSMDRMKIPVLEI